MRRLFTAPLHTSYRSSLTGFLTCRPLRVVYWAESLASAAPNEGIIHLELGFPEQLEDLCGDPVLYASRVCLLGVLVLHEGFLDQVPAPR